MQKNLKSQILRLELYFIAFVCAYSLSPLYTSNQNTYFLHGLAASGLGYLQNDWITKTIDPFPAFSEIVKQTKNNFGEIWFYFYQSVLLYLFIKCTTSIIGTTILDGNESQKQENKIYFAAALLVTLSLATSFVSKRILEIDLRGLVADGLAGQNIISSIFQPSMAGIFLIAAADAFLHEKKWQPPILVALAITLHQSYLLSGLLLVLAFSLSSFFIEKNPKKSLTIPLVTAILLLPIGVYTAKNFKPSTKENSAVAQKILAEERIPHHAKLFEQNAVYDSIKIGMMAAAVAIAWRHKKLRLILLVPLAGGFMLSIIQIVASSNFLALTFPWRVSTVLVPLSTAILLAHAIKTVGKGKNTMMPGALVNFSVAVLATLGAVGFFVQKNKIDESTESSLFDFIKQHKQPDEIYLIPENMERFRIATGAPAFVDWKTHPYKDTEVIEWRQRIQVLRNIYSSSESSSCPELKAARQRFNITHIVTLKKSIGIDCQNTSAIYENEDFKLLRLTK